METEQLSTLVEQAKTQDGEAVTQLYEEYHNGVYFLCLKIVKNEDDALDLVQDSFLQAFNKLDTLQNPARFGSWLNQIAANKCRDYLKKKKPDLFSQQKSGDEAEQEEEPEIEDRDENLIPDQALDTEETRRLIMGIIDGLPDLQRMTVMLYYYEEKSVKEIAEIMECSENTVKSRLNYARKQIKEGVLDLEKKGTKLYGVMPMLFPLIRHAAADFTVPSGASASMLENLTSAISGGSVTATSGTMPSGSLHNGFHTIVKKVLKGSARLKIVASAAAVAVIVGAIAGIANLHHKVAAPAAADQTVSSNLSKPGKSASKKIDEKQILNQYLASLPRKTQKQQAGYKDVLNIHSKYIKFTVTRTLVGSKMLDCNCDGHKELLLKYLHQSDISGKPVKIFCFNVIGVINSKPKPIYEYETNNDCIDKSDGKQLVGCMSYIHTMLGDEYGNHFKIQVIQNIQTQKILILESDDLSYTLTKMDTHNDQCYTNCSDINRASEAAKYDAFKKELKTNYKDITNQIQWDSIK